MIPRQHRIAKQKKRRAKKVRRAERRRFTICDIKHGEFTGWDA